MKNHWLTSETNQEINKLTYKSDKKKWCPRQDLNLYDVTH
jgi:hypothetical protein